MKYFWSGLGEEWRLDRAHEKQDMIAERMLPMSQGFVHSEEVSVYLYSVL